MQDQSDGIRQAIEELSRRVEELEKRLGVPLPPEQYESVSSPEPAPAPPAPLAVSLAKSQAFARLTHTDAPPDSVVEPPSQAPAEPTTLEPLAVPGTSEPGLLDHPAAPTSPPRTRPPLASLEAVKRASTHKTETSFSIERLIGSRWLAWGGALFLVIGVSLFVKLAYDQHWLTMPPAWRCALGAAFGLVLIGGGELVRRKINAAASAGLLAAGVGSIYASVFAAYRLYDLLPPAAALSLLAVVAAMGILVGARARLLSVSVVSLVGGYLAPFLMDTPTGNPAVLPLFLLTLLGVGLVLSARLQGVFTVLRTLTWWATVIIGGFWVLNTGRYHLELCCVFLGLTWAGIHAELVILARRGQLIIGTDGASQRTSPWKTWRPLTSSFSTTAWAVFLGVKALDTASVPDWTAPAGLLAGAALLWLVLAGNLASLRERPRTDAERLGACLGVQAAGLLIAAISLAMGGWGEVVCWIALGVSSIVAGRWLRVRAFDTYGLVVLTLCAGRLILLDSWYAGMTAGGEHLMGFVVSRWAWLMAATAGAWISMALVVRPNAPGRWLRISNTMMGVGTCLLFAALVHSQADVWTYAALATSAAMGLAFSSRLLGSAGLATSSMLVMVVATGLLAPTQWWETTSPDAASLLGLYLVPRALVLGYVAIGWLAAPILMSSNLKDAAKVRDFGIAAGITVLAAGLMHVRSEQTALAFVVLTAGLALFILAPWRRAPALAAYGAMVLISGTAVLLATRWWQSPGFAEALGLRFSRGMVVALYGATAWGVAAVLVLRLTVRDREVSARICLGVALVLLFGAFVHVSAELSTICVVWLALSLALGAARNLRPQLATDAFALIGLAASTAAWTSAYAVQWTPNESRLLLHPGLGAAVLLAGAWALATGWSIRMPERTAPARSALRALGSTATGGILFAATSLEVARIAANLADDPHVRTAAVSIWWGVFAAILVVGGFWKRATPARHAGLCLLAIAMAKVLLIDLRGVPPIWRIASFIGLGLLMLGVAVVYSKVSATWDSSEDPPLPDPGPLAP